MSLELIDSVSFFLYTFILYFLSVLSKRLGEVMGMKKYYYIYYAGMFFTLSASVIMILWPGEQNSDSLRYGYALFATGLTLAVVVLIKYWGWLLKELVKGQHS